LKVCGWDKEPIKVIWPILDEARHTKWSLWGEAEKGQEKGKWLNNRIYLNFQLEEVIHTNQQKISEAEDEIMMAIHQMKV
jgi:hypothetical protein